MGSMIWKPVPNTPGKGPVFLVDTNRTGGNQGAPVINVNGKAYTGTYRNTENGINQYEFPKELLGMQNLQFTYGGQTGTIASGGQSYEGDSLTNWQPRARGSAGGGYGGGYGGTPNFSPGTMGGFGIFPAYMGGAYPTASLATFNPIAGANYQFTDPLKYAQQFGDFNRSEYQKNQALAKGMALDQIDTELQGLQAYAPAAAALKREQTSLDNSFNQAQRLAQVNQAMPGAQQTLQAQAARAATYAAGGLPDTMQDRALELGVRSRAADQAAAGGFGAGSSVARKASDLMSAEQRLQIAQYGEQLTGQNLQSQEQLLLAPTEYSNAGQQISAAPQVSAAQLQSQNLSGLNAATMVSATNALQSTTQQNQFSAGLQQQTQQFNAQGMYNASALNAGIQNSFSKGLFDYNVGYAGAVAGAAQNDVNTALALQQQAQAKAQAEQTMGQAQTGNTISAGIGAIGQIAGMLNSAFGGSGSSGYNAGEESGIISNIPSIIGNGTPSFDTGYESPSSAGSVPSITEGGAPSFDIGYEGSSGASTIPSYDSLLSSESFNTYASQVPLETARSILASPSMKGYAADTGLSAADTLRLAFKPSTEVAADSVLANAGISNRATANSVAIGSDYQGQTMYANPQLQNINSISPGLNAVSSIKQFVGNLGVQSIDSSQFNKLSEVINSPDTHAQLDNQANSGDAKGFTKTAQTLTNTQGIMSSGLAAYKLAQAWPRMSTGQKSLALASLGIQGIKSTYGSLAKTPVETSAKDGYGPMSVSGALSIASMGINAAEVAANWGDLNNAQRILGGTRTATNLAQLGINTGLISKTGNVATGLPYVNLAASAYQISQGWNKMGTEQKAVAGAALAQGGAMAAGYTIPGLNIALAAYQGVKFSQAGYDKYFANGTSNQKLGYTAGTLLGGAGFVTGIGMFSMFSGLGSAFSSGKSAEQKGRDAVRSVYKNNGFVNDNWQISLADGSVADIGVDGHGGQHEAKNPGKLVGDNPQSSLKAYDIDYTNDMDYAAGMTGMSLNRLLFGGRSNQVDQMGGQLGNATLGSVGYGKDMNEQNFNTVMGNARGMWAKSGIKTKEDALGLLYNAGRQGRLTAADQAQALQTINMMYDKDGFQTAQQLMSGRWTGINNMAGAPARTPTIQDVVSGTGSLKIVPYGLMRSRQDIKAANIQRYGQVAYG